MNRSERRARVAFGKRVAKQQIAAIAAIKAKQSNPRSPESGGYRNEHHLIEERVPPPSLVALRNELQLSRHRDIYDIAKQGATFEDCIGKIAASLDIALDGVYDVPDLCQLLVKALQLRGEHGNKMHEIDPRLTSARLVERSDTLALEEGSGVIASPPVDEFSLKMRDWGCSVCNDKKRCEAADRCLDVTVEEATATAPQSL